MQDAIGRIYFLDRKPGTPTAVIATCTGLAGVTIPVGARAQAVDGNLYLCTQAGTIPASGSVDLPFACSVDGPVDCAPGALNQIYQPFPVGTRYRTPMPQRWAAMWKAGPSSKSAGGSRWR